MPDAGAPLREVEAPRRSWRRRLVRLVLLVLVPAAVLLAGGVMFLQGGRWIATDNAYIRADKLTISTDVSGIVAAVAVRDNQRIAAGAVLFRLDEEPFRTALARADAQLGVVRNEIETLRANHREKLEAVRQAEGEAQYFDREFQRQAELARRDIASRMQFDKARRDLERARQEVVTLRQEAAGILASLGGSADLPVEENPRWQVALADRDQAARNLRRTVVTAPVDAIVSQSDKLHAGQYLPAAQPALMLIATSHVWVEANPKETDLTNLREGQAALVTVDAYPGVTWRGVVESVSPASGAEFSLLPPQNTSGNWVKVVQRIPVRVRVELSPDQPPLRAGMSAEVEIDTGHQRTIAGLLHSAFGREPR